MSIAGNLKTMALPDIFQWLANGHFTGTLLVSNGDVMKSIYFRNGDVVSCNSTEPKEFLGHFLVSHGCITEAELAAAVEEQERGGELLGTILVDQGAVTRAELQRMLALKAEESIFELFMWPDGDFRFLDGELPDYEMVPISLNVTSLTLEGIRRVDEWQRIRERIPSLQCVPVAVGDLLDGETDEARRAVLEQVNDDRSVEEICLQTHSGEYFVSEILFQKAREGRLKAVRPKVVTAAPDRGAGTTAKDLLEQARSHLAQNDPEQALRRLRAAASLEPDNRELATQIRELEAEMRAFLQDAGVDRGGVPALTGSPAQLSSVSLTPEEGFILSRIGGGDLGAILKISPLPELEALVVFWKLQQAGLVEITYR